jgi:broad specificity phosphatase PhoE
VGDRLVLICHAPTAATRSAAFPTDEPLDAAGLAAARAASAPRAATALTGPALRCVQTAAALGLAARVEPALRDADPGAWAGRGLDDVAATEPEAVAAWLRDPAAAPPGGESWVDVRRRAARWLAGVGSGVTVAVTHAAVIRALVVHVLDAPSAACWRVDAAPLTRTVLAGGPDRWTVRTLAAPL